MDPQLRTLDSRLRGNDGAVWTFDGACSHDRRRRTADENWGSVNPHLPLIPGGLGVYLIFRTYE